MNDIGPLKIRVQRPFPLKGIERKIFAVIALLLISGIALSISVGDWQYFSGSGSLVVIVGITVTWRDIAGNVQWFENMAKQTIEKELGKLNSTEPRGLIALAQKEAVEKKLGEYSKNLDELFVLLRRRLRTIEALTLIIGTFISGYGSVIGTLINKIHS
jgi:hypothetical protein